MAVEGLEVYPDRATIDRTRDIALAFGNDPAALQQYWRSKVNSILRDIGLPRARGILHELSGQRDDVHDTIVNAGRPAYQDERIPELP
jgi:hypothetical protein